LLLAPPQYHYDCCFLSLPLPVPPVDCCLCLLWLSLFLKMTLLLRLLPVMLPLHCLAVTTIPRTVVFLTLLLLFLALLSHYCWLPVDCCFFLAVAHPCQRCSHHFLLLLPSLLLTAPWFVDLLLHLPLAGLDAVILVAASSLLLQSHSLADAAACCIVLFGCHIFAAVTAITAG